jgi:hypothetical protein
MCKALILVLGILVGGCAALSKPPAGPSSTPYRDDVLLDAGHPTLLVEVDYVAGAEPRARALRIFRDRLGFYCDKPDGIEIRVDDEVPADSWEASHESVARLALEYADEAVGETAYLYVLYAPSYKKFRGYSYRTGRLGEDVEFPAMVVFAEQLRPILWLTGVRQEASVLVHEAGHVLGLVTNDDHRDGGHCTNGWCLMYDGVDARSLAVNLFPTLFTGYLPTHVCRDCRDDLWDGAPPPGIQRLPGMPTAESPGCDPSWKEEP